MRPSNVFSISQCGHLTLIGAASGSAFVCTTTAGSDKAAAAYSSALAIGAAAVRTGVGTTNCFRQLASAQVTRRPVMLSGSLYFLLQCGQLNAMAMRRTRLLTSQAAISHAGHYDCDCNARQHNTFNWADALRTRCPSACTKIR